MWLIIVAVLLIAGIWVGGYFLSLPLLLQIGLTVAIVLIVAGILVFRRVRAIRAARALEREILAQAEMQAATARPDRRAEILALQAQMKQGIAALKKSKLAVASGGGALYSLPWYMIVGPPGAGKTTALRHSGLVFPTIDPSQGGIKGLGGTRNCDWWFTNEAVLLDTAGRYATADDDRDEWFAFLDMLKRHRSKAPINGMLVAISVTDLAGQSEEQIEQIAQVLRARIDEVIARLQMVVPVYVMFTKVDLVAGFVEFWEDLRKSERAQIWGASFEVQRPRDFDPAKAFAQEFDLLTEKVHARAISRMRGTRRADARNKVLQFPLEFASLRDDLSLFLGRLFQANAYQETPLLRGAYFTSGTQEGRPLDRVMAGMARAFGLGFDTTDAAAPPVDPKSYFLTEVFQRVVFPDRSLAVRTAVEARRRMLMQLAIGSGAVILAAGIAFPGLVGFLNNRKLVETTATLASNTQVIDPSNRDALSDRIARLSDLKGRLEHLDRWEDQGADWDHRFGMYTGPTLRPAVLAQFGANMRVSFVQPMKAQLEQRLQAFHAAGRAGAVSPDIYVRYYNTLKTYLMLTEVEHLDVDWVTPRLGADWAEFLRVEPADRTPTEDLVRKYLSLQKEQHIQPSERDEVIVAQARGQLRNTPRLLGDYERLMERVRPGTVPIGRLTVFGATAASRYVTSRTGVEVDGVYTRLGWERVRKELNALESTLEGEVWVLGEGAFDPSKAVDDVRKLYFEKYTHAWELFIRDLDINRPANVEEALPQLLALTEPEWPYRRLARTVKDNMVLDLTAEEAGMDGTLADDLKDRAAKAKALKAGDAGALLAEKPHYPSPMERKFKQFIDFSVPPPPAKPDEPPPATNLDQYQTVLSKLVASLTDHKQKGADARGEIKALETEFQEAYRAVVKLLAEQNTFTRDLLQDLLLKPITLSWASVVHDAAGVSGAFWEISVYRQCQAKLHGSFPFNSAAHRDTSLQDFAEFFRPKTGTLWGFYDQNVGPAVEQRGGEFIPRQRFEQRTPYSGTFLSFLERSDEITDAFFGEDGKTPSIEFSLNLHSVSPNVAEVTFEVDGKPHTYKNTPEDWMAVTWPSKDAKVRGAKVRIRGFSGLVEEILDEGDFGLFRLLGRASVQRGTAGGRPGDVRTLVYTWQLESQQAEVKMDLRPAKSDNAFEPGFFSDYRCPRIISEGGR